MHARRSKSRPAPPGLAARNLAHELIAGVLIDKRPLEQALAGVAARPDWAAIEPRDRAFARMLAATVLRRQGELEHVLGAFLERPLSRASGRMRPILLAGATQLLFLGTPPHAAVGLAVEAARGEPGGGRFAALANAVLRRVAIEGKALLAGQDAVRLNIPAWLWQRWRDTYGEADARRIAEASLREPPLDLTLKPGADAGVWAARLDGRLLPTGSIRLAAPGRVEDLPGFAEGAWWVQGAAAALVVHAAGDVGGRPVADLCAAPGGKTAGLAAAGAQVTAVDDSHERLDRLRENLRRLDLAAEIVAADVTTWAPGRTFAAVVLDAPCTATGTIARHPDILRLKGPADVGRMAKVQQAMLANAARLVRPGGVLVYSTCSLESEEGRAQVDGFLEREPAFRRVPLDARDIGAEPEWIAAGDLRTLPFHLGELGGIDGFYVARLQRRAGQR
jgi:16S rRNA (cytosine967-C5)-methyltransferase